MPTIILHLGRCTQNRGGRSDNALLSPPRVILGWDWEIKISKAGSLSKSRNCFKHPTVQNCARNHGYGLKLRCCLSKKREKTGKNHIISRKICKADSMTQILCYNVHQLYIYASCNNNRFTDIFDCKAVRITAERTAVGAAVLWNQFSFPEVLCFIRQPQVSNQILSVLIFPSLFH